MDEQERKGQITAISTIVVIMAALGIFLYTKVPLKGLRPYIPKYSPSEKVQARLWQDPFRAVLNYKEASKLSNFNIPLPEVCDLKAEQGSGQGTLKCDIQKRFKDWEEVKSPGEKKKKITVLGVMVPGGPYAEDTETRIRSRYAVLSGLRRCSYVPDDPEHISFFKIQKDGACIENKESGSDKTDDLTLTNIVPFEWLKQENDIDEVLLLWINDTAFKENPLRELDCLFSYLQPENYKIDFKLIGPWSSTTLIKMIKELDGYKSNKLKGLKIYSATATVPAYVLLKKTRLESKVIKKDIDYISLISPDNNNKLEEYIQNKFLNCGISFTRTICTDQQLADQLIKEIKRRHVDLVTAQIKNYDTEINNNRSQDKYDPYHGHRDHIILISEWDTDYGRNLPRTFIDALISIINKTLKNKIDNSEDVKWIHLFSYLRGIDGKLPGEQEHQYKELPKKDTNGQKDEDIERAEEPTGKSQYDYLRRLAKNIRQLDQHLQDEDRGSIKAIGVLGSDFYDKYLVLQALGQELPGKIFFSNDLDARLFHSAYSEWTRNLVVASGFGLRLNDYYQGDVPPFRRNYQTSMFLTTQYAFSQKEGLVLNNISECVALAQIKNPRIFEIGYSEAIDLTPSAIFGDSTSDSRIHPPRYMTKLPVSYTNIIFIIILSFSFFFLLSITFKRSVRNVGQFITKNPDIALLILLLISSYIFFQYKILNSPTEEPFSLGQGVSVCPTNIIRFVALMLSWIFLFTAKASIEKNAYELAIEFRLGKWDLAIEELKKDSKAIWSNNLHAWWHRRASLIYKLWSWFVACPQRFFNYMRKPKDTNFLVRFSNTLKKVYMKIRYDWEPQDGDNRDLNNIWEEYIRRGKWGYRLARIIPIFIIYIGICALILHLSERPVQPVRGDNSFTLFLLILSFTIISFLFLSFFVLDATILCKRFIDLAFRRNLKWPRESLAQFTTEVGLTKDELSDLMLVRLVAKRTEVVSKLIFFPLIIWFLVIVSRLYYFDNHVTSIGLTIVITLHAVVAWSCTYILRRSAEANRTSIIDHLSQKLVGVYGDKTISHDHKERLEFVLNEVQSIKQGAFAPFFQHPLLQSLYIPFGGIGGLSLLEKFLK